MYTCLLQGVCIRSVHFDSAGFQLCKRDDCGSLSYTRNLNITLTTGSLAKKSRCGQLTRFLAKIPTKICHNIIQETLGVSSTSILSSLRHCTTTLQREQTKGSETVHVNQNGLVIDLNCRLCSSNIVLFSGPLVEPEAHIQIFRARLPKVV